MHDPVRSPAIRKLGVADLDAFRAHLLRLDAETRRSRFGGPASDWFVEHYAERAFDGGTTIHGVFFDGRLIGCGELCAWDDSGVAEAAFSVETSFQGLGLGSRLMRRVLLSACNRGIATIRMQCLAGNLHMQHLARRAGADLLFEADAAVAIVVGERRSFLSVLIEGVRDARVRVESLCGLWAQRPLYLGFSRAL